MRDAIFHILFVWYPYVCLSAFIFGSLIRFDREQYTWKASSSQLLRKRQQFTTTISDSSKAGLGQLQPDIGIERLFLPGATITSIYGSTEYIVMARYVHWHGAPFPYATMPMGHLLEPGAVLLLGSDGAPVPPGERGEVVVASPVVVPAPSPVRTVVVFAVDTI